MRGVEQLYLHNQKLEASQKEALSTPSDVNSHELIRMLEERNTRIAELERLLDHKTQELWKLKLESNSGNVQQFMIREFIIRLKKVFPALSANDLRICSLLRQNFSTKEVAQHLGIGADSANKARYRIRRKLNLQRSDDLIQFLLVF